MQFYQLSQTSLAKSGSSIVEEYIPLWMSDGTYATLTTNSIGIAFIISGSTSFTGSYTRSDAQLHTLNSNWNASTKFAFEASIYIGNGSNQVNACLWDMTSNTQVVGSTVSTSSTTLVVLRSSQFNLIPSHAYGVTLWQSGANYNLYISDASLIAFS